MTNTYILVQWPESRKFLDRSDCYKVNNYNLKDACFVPEYIYNDDWYEDVMLSLAEQV